jgi:hypothetical protein
MLLMGEPFFDLPRDYLSGFLRQAVEAQPDEIGTKAAWHDQEVRAAERHGDA